jgi:hypothetical protein
MGQFYINPKTKIITNIFYILNLIKNLFSIGSLANWSHMAIFKKQ